LIKVGDKVATFSNMGKTGVVIKLIPAKINAWMIGGAAGGTFTALVEWDANGKQPASQPNVSHVRLTDLMRLE